MSNGSIAPTLSTAAVETDASREADHRTVDAFERHEQARVAGRKKALVAALMELTMHAFPTAPQGGKRFTRGSGSMATGAA